MPRKPKTDGENAISLRSAHRTLAPWLRPDPFPPIPPEGEYDWPRGKGQTFDDYVAANPSKPSAPADGTTYRRANSGGIKIPGTVNKQRQGYGRYKIYLQPLGDTDDAFPDLSTLAAGCYAFFGLPTEVLPMITLKELEARGHTKIEKRGRQKNAACINNNLKMLLPSDGFTLCGVTMKDIYKGDMNYLFGLAFMSSRVGIFSFYRHQPNAPECEFHHGYLTRQPGDEHVLLRRAMATLTHELGHTFGLKHCVFYSCLMQGANSLEEAENRLQDLCPVCLRKLLYCTRQESADGVRTRYERLHAFYRKHKASFGPHLDWVTRRLGMVEEEAAPTGGPVCEPCEDEEPPTGATPAARAAARAVAREAPAMERAKAVAAAAVEAASVVKAAEVNVPALRLRYGDIQSTMENVIDKENEKPTPQQGDQPSPEETLLEIQRVMKRFDEYDKKKAELHDLFAAKLKEFSGGEGGDLGRGKVRAR